MEKQKTQDSQTILNTKKKKKSMGGTIISDLKLYYKVVVEKNKNNNNNTHGVGIETDTLIDGIEFRTQQ
jgi:hypothetical protein